MSDQNHNIIVFIISTIALILLLLGFIITILYFYQSKQMAYQRELQEINFNYDRSLLHAQLEIQEQTLQDVSREIHDNISLGLTLSKLHLNTLNHQTDSGIDSKIEISVSLITEAIEHLRNISKSLNSDIIKNNGLIKAIENEIEILNSAGLFKVDFDIEGVPCFMDTQHELVLFRIIQESFNNIIKHAAAEQVRLIVHYQENAVHIKISDDGVGFPNDPANWEKEIFTSG
jgi:two-component system, NarL family, sensor kinase